MLLSKLRTLVNTLHLRLKLTDASTLQDLPLDFCGQLYLELNPDVAEKKVNPYLHYLRQGKAENRPFKAPQIISSSSDDTGVQTLPEDFAPEEYLRLNPDLQNSSVNLEEHFLKHGIFEFRRYKANKPPAIPNLKKYRNLPKDFDPEDYLTLNPDLLDAPINAHDHYAEFGHSEGRLTHLPQLISSFGIEYDPHKPTVLLISHEASRTGAPILAWNLCQYLNKTHNTVVLLLGDGGLISNFQLDVYATYVMPTARHDKAVAKLVVDELNKRHHFDFAILNSIETGVLCKPLTVAKIPSILLIHEFAAYTTPKERFLDAYMWASATVFSNNLIKSNAISCFPDRLIENAHVLPQGKCVLPPSIEESITESSKSILLASANEIQPIKSKQKLILGVGTICMRKGVELFIEVATRMTSMTEKDSLQFVWIGAYPPYSHEYSAFLNDQIERSGMSSHITIAPETSNLDQIYNSASLLLLTSRLDPLPNVAIDAICSGLPIVCFDKASGIADILTQCNLGEQCVAEYINTIDMAAKAVRIVNCKSPAPLKDALKRIGSDLFSMPSYYKKLFDLRHEAIDHLKNRATEVEFLIDSKQFDPSYYTGVTTRQQSPRLQLEECWEYVLKTRIGNLRRKPKVGFNPYIYRERLDLPIAVDPLFHYSQNISTQSYLPPHIITPRSESTEATSSTGLRVALHIHAFYPSLLSDILDRLVANRTAFDLHITVDTEEKAGLVAHILQNYDFSHATVTQHINQGRDVYPFLWLCERILQQYDVIGHVHTKVSPHATHIPDLVPKWRNLVLGNLLGSIQEERMLDKIISYMSSHPEVQIIFPDDPFVEGWGDNYKVAKKLIPDTELRSLPYFFDFPIGTMFWARSEYLKYFTSLNIPERFPLNEPLPIDGTVLHAWERLLGAKVGANSSIYALTSVPGLTR